MPYIKTSWKTGDTISASKLNHIEDGIEMALDLNEYIKMSYERPNRKVLEGLCASEDLIEYLMETPGNTNWNVVKSMGKRNEKMHTMILKPTEFIVNDQTRIILAYELNEQEISVLSSVQKNSVVGTIDYDFISSEQQNIEGTVILSRIYDRNESDMIIIGSSPVILISTSINDKNYLIEATGASEGIVTVNYEVVDGYNIFFDDDNYQYPWFSVRKGESFIIPDFIMGQYTDEINTYQAGDIITPISDITLTIIR